MKSPAMTAWNTGSQLGPTPELLMYGTGFQLEVYDQATTRLEPCQESFFSPLNSM